MSRQGTGNRNGTQVIRPKQQTRTKNNNTKVEQKQ